MATDLTSQPDILNDRKECTFTIWVDDAGNFKHIVLVQRPGQPFEFYWNGERIILPGQGIPS